MKNKGIIKSALLLIFSLFLLLFFQTQSTAWGFYGHKRINRMAVFTLPSEMMGFYKKHIEFVTEHAVDPDKRRYAIEDEAPRHYIDIDHYGAEAFQIVPQFWKDAVKKFTEDTLKAYGIVPWHIDKMMYRLTEAFKAENIDQILRLSADLGHYIADAHVPLHTTENYNGQKTNQKGIHGFWESRIPELKAESYDYFVGAAHYIQTPIKNAWRIVKDSHAGVDSVLSFEAKLHANWPSDKKYTIENRGAMTLKTYSSEYTEAYDAMIKGQVERRMREAIMQVGSAWYTCWVNAGKPNLDKINDKEIADSLKELYKREEELYLQQKIKNAKGHDD